MRVRDWVEATRPKTLPAAVAPVLAGTAIAFGVGVWQPVAAVICLFFALLLQVGTNFANDYYDFVKGADRPSRRGPTRASASGKVEPEVMRRAALWVFAAAFLVGLQLVWFGGWWLVPLGILCILSGWAYTAGPFPLAYNGLGDGFVFLFFGLVAVNFTYFVQAGGFSPEALAVSIGIGALAANILVINNLRDHEDDRLSRKNTLAVLLGKPFALGQFLFQTFLAVLVPLGLAVATGNAFLLIPLLAFGLSVPLGQILHKVDQEVTLANRALAMTGQQLALYGILWWPAYLL
ncbi:MAG: 1,4-dihydroxy-2-naphthoate polyprenyltransferase [Opitutales bacterium]|nr:1,4-dihydroxy-2-naphthoate polyprenyltransferase [Opitutales bacterium]